VRSVRSAASEAPIRPNSVRGPVAETIARACPFTTSVPEYARPLRSASSAPGHFSTGSDSPVSSDSSTMKSLTATSWASAGTRSPSASSSRSPRTTAAPAMRCATPSRTTVARGLDKSRSASSARSVLRCCTIVIARMTRTDAASTSASRTSPSTR
jgi:hypothetical protein